MKPTWSDAQKARFNQLDAIMQELIREEIAQQETESKKELLKMFAFHGDAKIKALYLKRVR